MAAKSTIPGRKVPQGGFSAFVPVPLPPKLEWTPRLIRVLSEADRLIGKLGGEGGRLPNPQVISPVIKTGSRQAAMFQQDEIQACRC